MSSSFYWMKSFYFCACSPADAASLSPEEIVAKTLNGMIGV